jgi:signal transduction histidine kinase/FixJ family two-component response regulator
MAVRGTRTLVLADEARAESIARCIELGDPNAEVMRERPDDASATVDRLRPDVVLTASDGPLLRSLREQRGDLPIVAVVTDGDGIQGAHALDEGATDVVVERELEPRLLVWRLRLAIDRHESERHLREATRLAERASAHKSDFLSSMSHELRTPLNTILGMAELLGETALDDRQRGYVTTLQRASDHVLALIEDVLDLARIEAGTVTMADVGFDLYEVVESALDLVRMQARRKKLDLGWNAGLDVPREVRGDPRRVRQVLVNLLMNAVKFTEVGRVWLSIALDKSAPPTAERAALHLTVTDTGIGVPADKLDTIFTGFVQADRTIESRFGGFGLGLDIAKRIVERMTGRIWVESTAGKGSAFHVALSLPIERGAVAPSFVEPKGGGRLHVMAPDGQRLHVLVVDDSEDNRAILGEHLRGASVDVAFASDGVTAIEKAMAEPFDAVFMDLQMPLLDGYATTRELLRRAREAGTRPPPIIALSAHVLAESFARSVEAGCSMQLTKPIRKRTLLEALARATGARVEEPKPARGPIREEILALLPKFFANRRNDVRVIRDSLERKDLRAVGTIAHNMRGTGASYGFPEISALGDRLQDAGKREDREEIARLGIELEALLDELERAYAGAAAEAAAKRPPPPTSQIRVQAAAPEPTGTDRR